MVTLEALEPFRTASPVQDPEVLDYLKFEGDKNYDINLEVYIQPENGDQNLICESNYKTHVLEYDPATGTPYRKRM